MHHENPLYPHWLKVREVLQELGCYAPGTVTTGDVASRVIEALRPALTNDTTPLYGRLHQDARDAGWVNVLFAFARACLNAGYHCALRERDGQPAPFTDVLLIQLPSGQVSFSVSEEEARRLIAMGVTDLSPDDAKSPGQAYRWDGHTREEKYERLRDFALLHAGHEPICEFPDDAKLTWRSVFRCEAGHETARESEVEPPEADGVCVGFNPGQCDRLVTRVRVEEVWTCVRPLGGDR